MKKNGMLTIIIIALFVGVVAYGLYYRAHNYKEVWIECKYQGDEENYDETMRFRYLVTGADTTLYGYYHDEVITPIDENDRQKTIERYNKIYEPVKDSQSKNFVYELKEEDNKIKVNTYINVAIMGTTFNNYMNNHFNIKSSSTYQAVAKEMKSNSFECVVNKR